MQIFYDQLFRTADVNQNGVLPAAVVRELFLRSKLGKTLAQV
jgi:hypothetical protein